MSEPFIAEIKMFAGNFAPRGYALCNGQLLPINQNQALFSLLGTTYGGNGSTNFALPDLRGRMPVQSGQGPGLSSWAIGQSYGAPSHTLTAAEMPQHAHTLHGVDAAATQNAPAATVALAKTATGKSAYSPGDHLVAMSAPLTNAGGSQAHENRQPFLGMHFIIALQGIFPSRN